MGKPNFVFILCDQLRHDFLGCYGAEFVKTPNIDRIAGDGIIYDKAYTQSPVCVPARASLLTGRSPILNGVTDNGHWLRGDLGECGVKTLPEILNENGYYTAAVGKMHFHPWDAAYGFGYRVIAEDKRWIHIRDDYYKFLRQNGEHKYHGNEHAGYRENKGAILNRLPRGLSVDHFVGAEACKFIDVYGRDKPFALMVGFPGPHCPYDPCEGSLGRVEKTKIPAPVPEDNNSANLRQADIAANKQPWNGIDLAEFTVGQKMKMREHYAASVAQIDDEVGAILDAIKKNALDDNTVVIFSSDHGDLLGDHGLYAKGNYYEGSAHIPLIVHTPDIHGARRAGDLVALTDITATIVAMGGVQRPRYYDCTPLPGLGLDRAPYKMLFGARDASWFATDGRYKLTRFANGDIHFFDIDDDPDELSNLYDAMANPGAERTTQTSALFREFDNALVNFVMSSIRDSNFDKVINKTNDLWDSEEYAQQGRAYDYPAHI